MSLHGPRLEERRPPITPQLAMRVAMLGGVALVLFAIVFFRLWFLQVLSGESYKALARDNRVRRVRVEAPRGDIVDRNGQILVSTRKAAVVQIQPSSIPAAERRAADDYRRGLSASERERLAAGSRLRELERTRRAEQRRFTPAEAQARRTLARAASRARPVAVPPLPAGEPAMQALFRRLGRVLGMSTREVHVRVVRSIADTPYAEIVVKTDVRRDQFNYLIERRGEFPGVSTAEKFVRYYPNRTIGAQLFGTLREISPTELKLRSYRKLAQGDRIGKDGIEERYDRVLRGKPGADVYRVDAQNQRDETHPVRRKPFVQGSRLKLSLDLDLERAAESALSRAFAAARHNGNPARAGAYVAMSPVTGEVYALGSYPSFDANVFAKPISQSTYESLIDPTLGAPLINRAITGTYPTGSTFKPITALASLDSGILTPNRTIVDTGEFKLGPQTFVNAKHAKFGPLRLADALKVSSDVFFYTLGAEANARGPVIQKWAHRLGLGRPTGIDLPGEFRGLVPDRRWRDAGFARYQACVKRNHVPPQTFVALKACGGIERPWSGGDNVNLAVGQGDLLATPLQMATAYSALFEGGRVPRPHLGLAVEDGQGRMLQRIARSPTRNASFPSGYGDVIKEGLRRAANEPSGTSADVFKGFAGGRLTVYGKTGTVERPGQHDQSWYACYVNAPPGPLVVVVTIENGGFGAETAAPAARLILSQWFGVNDDKFQAGKVKDR